MAQYEATHACGHQQTHQIYGTDTRYGDGSSRRERIAARYAEGLCGDCFAARRQGERAEAATMAARQAAAAGLPELAGGTPKQIAWAERLRRATLDEIHERVAGAEVGFDDLIEQAMGVYSGVVARQASAMWWIDQRGAGDTVPPRTIARLATPEEVAELTALAAQGNARRTQP